MHLLLLEAQAVKQLRPLASSNNKPFFLLVCMIFIVIFYGVNKFTKFGKKSLLTEKSIFFVYNYSIISSKALRVNFRSFPARHRPCQIPNRRQHLFYGENDIFRIKRSFLKIKINEDFHHIIALIWVVVAHLIIKTHTICVVILYRIKIKIS